MCIEYYCFKSECLRISQRTDTTELEELKACHKFVNRGIVVNKDGLAKVL